ncbi:phage tail tape measure protein [Streptomyces sp. NBRC 110035]|uniref:phage tail tape measure protein n=1 Tax=Streptomyces sp. NBRC 110035 TaxID=1547867 RepID=UPI00131EB709|nr:phage tail tape measure protein [Streptomyces sp. NBRC 110035]
MRGADGRLRNSRGQFVRAGQAAGEAVSEGAEDAGEDAGRQLGQGLVRGADGQWRTMRGELVDAVTAAAAEAEGAARRGGQQAGQALGDGLADGTAEGADRAVDQAGTRMERLKQVAGGAAMAAGAAAGMLLMTAFSDAMDQSRITGRLGAQLGLTGPVAQRYGKIAGQLYTSAVVDTFQDGADTMKAVAGSGLIPPDATNAQIKSIATHAADLANTMEVDVGMAAQAAGIAVKTGLAKNSTEAFDMITKGMTGMGPAGEDLLETITEYGVQFQKSGLSGRTAFGLMRQAIQAGWKDTDKIADAFKELELRVTSGGKAQVEALQSVGLNADEMIADLSAGGKRGEEAMAKIHDAIVELGPESDVAKVAIQELFGGPGEDLGAAFFKLNLHEAQKAMGNTKGAADEMGNSLRDNTGTKVEAFKRGLQQGVVDFLGGSVIPGLETAKAALGGIWDDAGKGGAQGAERIVAFVPLLGQKLFEKVKELAPRMIEGLMGAGQAVAEWVMANPMQVLKIAAIAGAILMALAALPALVAVGLSATAITLMGGFVWELVTAAGSGLGSLGTSIGGWFSGLWSKYISGPVSRTGNSFITWVQGLPGRASSALSGLAASVTARASAAWTSFRDASVRRALGLVTWVAGLPSRISAGIGSLSGLLTQKGKNVVQGLWSGISGMGGWIRDKIIGWAKDVIPGPIAKALGIASPSKVTTAQGRWIARGLIDGLTGSSKQVRAASYKLVDIVRDSLTGKRRTAALKKINRDAGWLDWLASREAKVAAKLKTATKKMEDLRKARTKLAADVKGGILGDADITKQDTGGWPQTAETILAGLRQDTAAAQTFQKHLAALKKKGVRSDLIAQIAQAGVTGGASSAAALANANASQVKQINAQQKLLVGAAGQAGTTAGNAMYQAGIAAAQGLVKGLRKEQKTIENTMLRMAKGLASAMRKALGIKSPSRVMAVIGQYTAQGLIRGVEGQRSAVNSTMASLVETPAPGSWDMASRRARAAAADRTVIEIRSSGRGIDNFLVEGVRRGVQKKGGGDVGLVFSGRRSG